MGCDIHTIAQISTDGKNWRTVDCDLADFGRNYATFSALAGVRGSIDPLIYQRGLPKDLLPDLDADHKFKHSIYCSHEDDNKDDFNLGDHSFSFLTLEELIDIRNTLLPKVSKDLVNEEEVENGTEEPVYHFSEETEAVNGLSKFIGALTVHKLDNEVGYNHVRMVFGFDS